MSGYPKFNPLHDVFSGVILAATSVPQLIAYAELVGYESHRGLSTAGPPLAAWGLITGSPYLNTGVTSMTALMVQADLRGEAYVAQYGSAAYVDLVATYSLCVGMASLALAAVGFGTVARLFPRPVRQGFKWGSAVAVLVSALPNGLYARGTADVKQLMASTSVGTALVPYKATWGGGYTLASMAMALSHPWTWSLAPTLIFVAGTWFIMQGKAILPKWLPPGTEVLIVPMLATLYSMYFDFTGSVVGQIPTMDPNAGLSLAGGSIRIPVEVLDVHKLVTQMPSILAERCFGGSYLLLAASALTYAAVSFLSVMGICAIFESDQGISWSVERELCGQGVSCLVAGAIGSAPVSGSLSRSLVSRMTGTTSSLTCLVTALCWIYLQPYMGVLSPTPKAALSAVIVSAVLTGVVWPKDLFALTGMDALVAWSTGLATALTAPTPGFAFGMVLFLIVNLLFGSLAGKPKLA